MSDEQLTLKLNAALHELRVALGTPQEQAAKTKHDLTVRTLLAEHKAARRES